jgi:hypothetical protein
MRPETFHGTTTAVLVDTSQDLIVNSFKCYPDFASAFVSTSNFVCESVYTRNQYF